MKIRVNFVLFLLVLLTLNIFVYSQNIPIKIPLKIEKSHSQVTRGIFDSYFTKDDIEKHGKTPNGLLFKVNRNTDNKDVYDFLIDSNGNENLKDEKTVILHEDEKLLISLINKTLKIYQPFEISLQQTPKGDYISWRSAFQAKGQLKIGKCQTDIYLQEFNFNGIFELEDGGTNLQIDRNKDGKIWGREEHLYAQQVFEFCGNNYLVTKIAPDGSSLTLVKTNLKIAQIGGIAPDFELVSIMGKTLSSKNLIGKPYLIDFWATWCAVCIEKMPEINQLADKLPIIFVNTDNISLKNQALKLAEKLKISENSALGFIKESEILFKSYMRIEEGLPLYVLVNSENKIIYAGSGGKDLSDLKRELFKIGIQ